jgi:hypothetical protein
MKFRISVFATFCLSLLCIASAEDYEGLAGKGYRWVTVNGPYACTTEQKVRRITNNRTDATELQMVEDIEAYYLIPGTIVRVVQSDPATGMSEIQLGGITRVLWTYTKFLGARPMQDTYGVIETPKNCDKSQSHGATGEPAKSRMQPPARGFTRANLDSIIDGTLPSQRTNR